MIGVVLAGGRGTRLGRLTDALPKPLLDVAGATVLGRCLEAFRRYGVRQAFVMAGHLGEMVRERLPGLAPAGMDVQCVQEAEPLGTAGGMAALRGLVREPLAVAYGDVVWAVSLDAMLAFHRHQGAAATLAVHPTTHPGDSDLVETDASGRIARIDLKPRQGAPASVLGNAGLYILEPEVLDFLPEGPGDFMRHVFPAMLRAERPLAAYRTAEYLRDMGTPQRLAEVEHDLRSGRVERLRLEHPRPAVFLDRDGTLVESVHLLHRPEQLRLLPGAGEAVRRLNRADMLAVLATNQPVVARNLCSWEGLHGLHGVLELALAECGAHLDRIYACPHHPDAGYAGENPRYKTPCDCRKPAPGMLRRAAEELNVDLARSWMVGDSAADVLAGKAAGVRTFLVRTGPDPDAGLAAGPDLVADDLGQAVRRILGEGA